MKFSKTLISCPKISGQKIRHFFSCIGVCIVEFHNFAIEHLPVSVEEVHVRLIEPKGTLNTGNVVTVRTKEILDRI